MKIFCLIASVILSFSSISQKSYYFSDPLPSVDSKVDHVDSKFFGTYKSNSGNLSYELNENGISIISTSISSMSRESIRESSTFDVRNNYIFGVLPHDSIPCVLDDERYYFGIRNSDVFVGTGNQNVLSKTASKATYILNQYQNGNYIPMLLEFKGREMTISYFEYDAGSNRFDFIAEKKTIDTQFQELVVLSPSKEEFDQLKTQGVFDLPKVFKKN